MRDGLADRLQANRRTLGDRTYVEERNRRRIEEMMLEPERHKWVRVGNEDIGEPGCKHWHVRPRCGRARHADELVAGSDLLRLSVSRGARPPAVTPYRRRLHASVTDG